MQSRSSARVSLRRLADWASCSLPARRFGAAFALQENSASGLGNAFAGGAASAEDVSTIWANPAGMSRFATPQVAGAVHFVIPSFKFKDEGSQAAAFQPLGGTGGDAGDAPSSRISTSAMPINNQWAVGIGVNAPFGLVTEYDGNWLGRFQGVKSDIKTINVNPVAVVAGEQHGVGRPRRQLAARRRRAHEQGQLQRRRSRRLLGRRPPAD